MRVTIDGVVFDLQQGTYARDAGGIIWLVTENGLLPCGPEEIREAQDWGHTIWNVRDLIDLRDGRAVAQNSPFVQADWRAALRKRVIPEKIVVDGIPVIKETNEAGQRRLPLTRYKLLEKTYLKLVTDYNNLVEEYSSQVEAHQTLRDSHQKLEVAHTVLKSNAVEAEVVSKKLGAMVKELKLPVKLGNFRTMEQKLNAFFGALLASCRVNSNEPDEIAE